MDYNNSTTAEPEKDLAATPMWAIRSIGRYLNIRFELDACANSATAKVAKYYSLTERGQDSLTLPWSAITWCNPPYSDITPWVNKASLEAQRYGNTTVMLIPDKPETKVHRLCREKADTIVHMPFRLKFLRPDGTKFLEKNGRESSPKFPVMLAIFSPYGHLFNVRDEYYDFRNSEGKQA